MSTLLTVSGLGVLCLLLEVFNLRKILVPVVVTLLVAILGMACTELCMQKSFFPEMDVYNMISDTVFSQRFSILFILLMIFILVMSARFYKSQPVKIADFVAIKIFLLAGAVAMVSFGNMAMFFLGLEILSVAVYILASSKPKDRKSNEAGMKYFIMGAFASSFTLLGIALVYGATGSFDIGEISSSNAAGSVWYQAGMCLMAVGLFFKASVVPFHFWAPDVYEGSPTLVTALMSTLVRVAAIGALYKMFTVFAPAIGHHVQLLVMTLSVLTMTVGNITALRQWNIKRMMAYSGISHTGFMIMTLLTLDVSSNTIIYYAAAYSLAGIAAFSVILSVCGDKGNEDISYFYGLGRKKPVLAVILSCAMLSMGGLPVFAGFFAKFFVFQQTLAADYLVPLILGVINAIIAVFYYVRVINVVFTKNDNSNEPVTAPIEYVVVGAAAIVLNLLLGIFPSVIMG